MLVWDRSFDWTIAPTRVSCNSLPPTVVIVELNRVPVDDILPSLHTVEMKEGVCG